MRVPRLYLPDATDKAVVKLDERARHYANRVLRSKAGDALQIFDGLGHSFDAVLAQGGEEIKIEKELAPEAPVEVEILLIQGISKGERMDIVVQKATELGVTGIYPVFTEHCVVTMDAERADRRRIRWMDIAINACEQCGRNYLPEIHMPKKLDQLLPELDKKATKLVCHFGEPLNLNDIENSGKIFVLVGPEGGLSRADMESARQHKFASWQIGKRILRTETAAIAAVTLLQNKWGDLS